MNDLAQCLNFENITTMSWRFDSISSIRYRFQFSKSNRIFDFNYWNRIESSRLDSNTRLDFEYSTRRDQFNRTIDEFLLLRKLLRLIENDEDKKKSLSTLKLHVESYAFDDKYQVSRLSSLAMQNYEDKLERDWNSQKFTINRQSVQFDVEIQLRFSKYHFSSCEISCWKFQSNDAMREVLWNFFWETSSLFESRWRSKAWKWLCEWCNDRSQSVNYFQLSKRLLYESEKWSENCLRSYENCKSWEAQKNSKSFFILDNVIHYCMWVLNSRLRNSFSKLIVIDHSTYIDHSMYIENRDATLLITLV